MAFNLTDIDRIFAQIRRRLRLLEIQGNSGVLKSGLAANRPIGADLQLSPGTTISYYATDTKTLSVWNTVTETWDTTIFT